MSLATDKVPPANDFYTGGGKRASAANVEARNFLADAFLGRNSSLPPTTQFMHAPPPPPPPPDYYSHVAFYQPHCVGRDYDGNRSSSHSRSYKKRRYYSSSSESPPPQPRKRRNKKKHYSALPSTDDDANKLISID